MGPLPQPPGILGNYTGVPQLHIGMQSFSSKGNGKWSFALNSETSLDLPSTGPTDLSESQIPRTPYKDQPSRNQHSQDDSSSIVQVGFQPNQKALLGHFTLLLVSWTRQAMQT